MDAAQWIRHGELCWSWSRTVGPKDPSVVTLHFFFAKSLGKVQLYGVRWWAVFCRFPVLIVRMWRDWDAVRGEVNKKVVHVLLGGVPGA